VTFFEIVNFRDKWSSLKLAGSHEENYHVPLSVHV
jgi:hypothetical protein